MSLVERVDVPVRLCGGRSSSASMSLVERVDVPVRLCDGRSSARSSAFIGLANGSARGFISFAQALCIGLFANTL